MDDKPENLLALENILENFELDITKTTSGNEALGLMLEYEFALVLLDVQMPEMDGFETAELMRGNERTKQILDRRRAAQSVAPDGRRHCPYVKSAAHESFRIY